MTMLVTTLISLALGAACGYGLWRLVSYLAEKRYQDEREQRLQRLVQQYGPPTPMGNGYYYVDVPEAEYQAMVQGHRATGDKH